MAILSIQSSVAYGHVGNAAAAFCLRRLGHDVWPVDTVTFSHHPGYGATRGRIRPARDVGDLIDGLDALGVLGEADAVLSGYLGSAATGRIAIDAARRVRGENRNAFYACDPVMGDHDGGLYVGGDLVRFFRTEAVEASDVLLPNHFELETLIGRSLPTLRDVVAAAAALRTRGPRMVVVTSVATGDRPADEIATLAVSGDGAWLVRTPRLDLNAKGAGDALAALFVARLVDGHAAEDALADAVSALYPVIEATAAVGARELRLVAAQDAMIRPQRRFDAEPVDVEGRAARGRAGTTPQQPR